MRELLPDLEHWLKAGERVALATVISTWGSAPRPPGSFMAVSEGGGLVGSVSGGCVEGAVIQAAQEVIRTGRPQRLHFGVADETAWEVGLACGGEIDVLVQPAQPDFLSTLLDRSKAQQRSVLATVVGGPPAELGAQLLVDDKGARLAGSNGKLVTQEALARVGNHATLISQGDRDILLTPLGASPTLVIVGGGHIAVALASIARTLDFRSVIVDPRKTFASAERFAHADRLIQVWPQKAFEDFQLNSSSAVACLSHDPKIDDPALRAAFASDAFYIGALGSTKTQAKRRQRLIEAGVSEATLARLHAPIGVDIGAVTPEEIALAIMAQVIAAYRQ
ncbi:MAG: XdhC/CoxI family protein [Anaerolineales bacterium]